jgi:hypothetical protein
LRKAVAILLVSVPAMIITSHWRRAQSLARNLLFLWPSAGRNDSKSHRIAQWKAPAAAQGSKIAMQLGIKQVSGMPTLPTKPTGNIGDHGHSWELIPKRTAT